MTHTFYKYQGTGNDFILFDNRSLFFDKNDAKVIARLCDRKFGIGADGLMLIEADPSADFKMIYFNADGKEGSLCGNGSRCAVAFAHHLGLIADTTEFLAVDGLHRATYFEGQVSLKMNPVFQIKNMENAVFLDTGSPHHVCWVEQVGEVDVVGLGRQIRFAAPYGDLGVNVNFVETLDDSHFAVRTYERGVEDETLSCGTGVTAVALAAYHLHKTTQNSITIHTRGGDLKVHFESMENGFDEIYLEGPAEMVFKGSILL